MGIEGESKQSKRVENAPVADSKSRGASTKRSLARRLCSIFGNMIFIVSVLLIAFLVFQMVYSRTIGSVPSIAGYQLYIVAGGSMSPSFEAGSLAILEPILPEDIGRGDIITYKGASESIATTHRVMGVHEEEGKLSFTTRGDANDTDDANPVLAGDVIGRVAYTIPYLGILMGFSQTKKGLLILVIVPGVLLIASELRNLIKHAGSSNKKKAGQSAKDKITPGDL